MLTFVYSFNGVWRGGVVVVQAATRLQADHMFITEMLVDKKFTENNLKWRECTSARVIDENEVDVTVFPRGEEHSELVYDGDD